LLRSRPVISVTALGPLASWTLDALLDTGAEDTVFPEWVAARLGFDLTNAPVGSASGPGGGSAILRYAQITLRIADQFERREWLAWVGFTAAKLNLALLGFAGFLQYFTATFFGDREEVELTVNGSYPGT
jgi:predicted aspartyl protease